MSQKCIDKIKKIKQIKKPIYAVYSQNIFTLWVPPVKL